MNRVYRTVWNRALGQLVVASELASNKGTGNGEATVDRRGPLRNPVRRENLGAFELGGMARVAGVSLVSPGGIDLNLSRGSQGYLVQTIGMFAASSILGSLMFTAPALAAGGAVACGSVNASACGSEIAAARLVEGSALFMGQPGQ